MSPKLLKKIINNKILKDIEFRETKVDEKQLKFILEKQFWNEFKTLNFLEIGIF